MALSLFASATSVLSTVTWPANVIKGDVAVLFDLATAVTPAPTAVTPSGFVTPANANVTVGTTTRGMISYKICLGTESGALTGMAGASANDKVLLVFRASTGQVTAVTIPSAFTGQATAADPTLQTVLGTLIKGAGVVIGAAGHDAATAAFTTASPAFDATVANADVDVIVGYKMYNTGGSDHTIDMADLGATNVLISGPLQFEIFEPKVPPAPSSSTRVTPFTVWTTADVDRLRVENFVPYYFSPIRQVAELARAGVTRSVVPHQFVEVLRPRGWAVRDNVVLARSGSGQTVLGGLSGRVVDLVGGVQVEHAKTERPPDGTSRTVSPGPRYVDVAVFDPAQVRGWPHVGAVPAVQALTIQQHADQVVEAVETFNPVAWPSFVSTAIAPLTVAGLATQAQHFVEVFYPQAWRTAATTALPPVTVAGLVEMAPQFVETFYPRAWRIALDVALPGRTASGEALRPPTGVETFYPQARRVLAVTALPPVTVAGLAAMAPQFVEAFNPRPWRAVLDVTLPARTVSGEVRPVGAVETVDVRYPQAWRAASVVTLAPITVAGLAAQAMRFVELLYPQAGWSIGTQTAIRPKTAAGTINQLDHYIEAFIPLAWAAAASTRLEPVTRARTIQTDHYVETFLPQAWASAARTVLPGATVAGEVALPHREVPPPPGNNATTAWSARIDVRKMLVTVVYPEPWSPALTDTGIPGVAAGEAPWIHRARRRGRR